MAGELVSLLVKAMVRVHWMQQPCINQGQGCMLAVACLRHVQVLRALAASPLMLPCPLVHCLQAGVQPVQARLRLPRHPSQALSSWPSLLLSLHLLASAGLHPPVRLDRPVHLILSRIN